MVSGGVRKHERMDTEPNFATTHFLEKWTKNYANSQIQRTVSTKSLSLSSKIDMSTKIHIDLTKRSMSGEQAPPLQNAQLITEMNNFGRRQEEGIRLHYILP